MAQLMYPKNFIEVVLINEIGEIVTRHPYLSFTLISIGIEFIGKCQLTEKKTWDDINPVQAFSAGMQLLCTVNPQYSELNLRNELRNGFAHTFRPKSKIVLSEVGNQNQHLGINSEGRTILVAEAFYADFAYACDAILKRDYHGDDKMNQPFIRIGN